MRTITLSHWVFLMPRKSHRWNTDSCRLVYCRNVVRCWTGDKKNNKQSNLCIKQPNPNLTGKIQVQPQSWDFSPCSRSWVHFISEWFGPLFNASFVYPPPCLLGWSNSPTSQIHLHSAVGRCWSPTLAVPIWNMFFHFYKCIFHLQIWHLWLTRKLKSFWKSK